MKPVNLGFLDFSTLGKRRHFSQREVELNRRLAPEVYLGVVPIYKTTSGFSFDGEGEITEYTVKMQELPHGYFLNELLEQDRVGEKEIERVIGCLDCFYASETPTPEIEKWGAPEKLKISTDENFVQVETFVGRIISPAAFEAIRHFTNQFYVANCGSAVDASLPTFPTPLGDPYVWVEGSTVSPDKATTSHSPTSPMRPVLRLMNNWATVV